MHPHEQNLLTSLFDVLSQAPHQVPVLTADFKPEWLKDPDAPAVYQAMLDTASDANPSISGVLTRLNERGGTSVKTGGLLADLVSGTGMSPGRAAEVFKENATVLALQHAKQRLANAAAKMTESLHAGEDMTAATSAFEKTLADVRTGELVKRGIVDWHEILAAFNDDSTHPVIGTDFGPFDAATEGGLPRGGITVLGAPPASGKSLFAMQLAVGAMIHDPAVRVLYVKGEGTTKNLGFRLACLGDHFHGNGRVNMFDAKMRTKPALDALRHLTHSIGNRFTMIEGDLTTSRVLEAAITTKADIVVVDYLQLLRDDGNNSSRVSALDDAMGRLETFAGVQNISIIALTSIAKSVNTASRIGQIARDSSSIDYAASLFYIALPTDEQLKEKQDTGLMPLKWQCMKARNTAEVDLELILDGSRQVFRDAAATQPDDALARFGGD